jgi:hypothetical protein
LLAFFQQERWIPKRQRASNDSCRARFRELSRKSAARCKSKVKDFYSLLDPLIIQVAENAITAFVAPPLLTVSPSDPPLRRAVLGECFLRFSNIGARLNRRR